MSQINLEREFKEFKDKIDTKVNKEIKAQLVSVRIETVIYILSFFGLAFITYNMFY